MQSKKFSLVKIKVIASTFIAAVATAAMLVVPVSQALSENRDFYTEQAEALLERGIQRYKNGQFEAAFQPLQQALSIYQRFGDNAGVARVLSRFGDIYFSLGEYGRSLEFYHQSLEILQAIGEHRGEADVLTSLSNTYFLLGKEKEAKEFEEQAESVRRSLDNARQEAAFSGNVSLTYESRGEYELAVEFHQRQLQIARQLGDRFLEARSLNNLARAYAALGQYQPAIEMYQQQLALARQTSDRSLEMKSLAQMAAAYQVLGQHEKALELYPQQLALAREAGDILAEIKSLNQMAIAYEALGQREQANELYQKQLELARNKGDRLAEGAALNHLAAGLLKTGKIQEAQKTLQDAVKVWEGLRAKLDNTENYLPEQANTYRGLQQVAIAQNQPETALEIAEQGRFRNSLDLLKLRLPSDPVRADLKLAPGQFAAPTLASLKKIAREEESTFIEYSVISNREIYAWVIPPNGEIIFRPIDVSSQKTIYPISSIEELVASSREAKSLLPLQELYQVLIEPIAEFLPKDPTARVTFIPPKELLSVPFAALADLKGIYLIENHTIITAPSIQILAVTRQQRREFSGEKMLVLGNPTMPSIVAAVGGLPQPMPPLLSAEREALEVAQLLKTRALLGNQATKNAFLEQLPQAKSIHFATYGLLDDNQRMGIPGAIALAPSGNDSGLLAAAEILNLQLKAELVVISAGDAGANNLAGDGYSAIALSLISAGVPSIIISQSSAPDDSVAYLMAEFYRNLKKTRDKARSLRAAMLATLKQYPDSTAWAGLSLIGEAK